MTQRNRTEAYDLSLFDTRPLTVEVGGEPASKPSRKQQRRSNVIELPQGELERNRRTHPLSLRAVAVAGCLAVVLGVVSCVVYNQVQLNELTSQIAAVQTQLSEAQSVEVQLQMEASSNMTLTDVEAYAKDQLNMRKTGKNQVTYITLNEGDQGTVVQPNGGSVLDQIWSFFQNLLP